MPLPPPSFFPITPPTPPLCLHVLPTHPDPLACTLPRRTGLRTPFTLFRILRSFSSTPLDMQSRRCNNGRVQRAGEQEVGQVPEVGRQARGLGSVQAGRWHLIFIHPSSMPWICRAGAVKERSGGGSRRARQARRGKNAGKGRGQAGSISASCCGKQLDW